MKRRIMRPTSNLQQIRPLGSNLKLANGWWRLRQGEEGPPTDGCPPPAGQVRGGNGAVAARGSSFRVAAGAAWHAVVQHGHMGFVARICFGICSRTARRREHGEYPSATQLLQSPKSMHGRRAGDQETVAWRVGGLAKLQDITRPAGCVPTAERCKSKGRGRNRAITRWVRRGRDGAGQEGRTHRERLGGAGGSVAPGCARRGPDSRARQQQHHARRGGEGGRPFDGGGVRALVARQGGAAARGAGGGGGGAGRGGKECDAGGAGGGDGGSEQGRARQRQAQQGQGFSSLIAH